MAHVPAPTPEPSHLKDWVFTGWSTPVSAAVVAAAISVGIVFVGAAFELASSTVLDASRGIDWKTLIASPLIVWSMFHGGVAGLPLLLTGVLWVGISFRWAVGTVVGDGALSAMPPGSDRARVAVLALKTALTYAVLVVVVSTMAATIARDLSGQVALDIDTTLLTVSAGRSPTTSPGTAFVLAGVMAMTFTAMKVLRRRTSVRNERTAAIGAVSRGARRTLLIATLGGAAFLYLATLVDHAINRAQSGEELAGFALSAASQWLVWAPVDLGVNAVMEASRLFTGLPAIVPSGKPPWIYLHLLVIAAGFVAGGFRATRLRRVTAAADANATGYLAGACAGIVLGLGGLVTRGATERGNVLLATVLLTAVWGLLGAVGGSRSLAATRAGAPSPSTRPPGVDGVNCPSCGVPNAGSARFCISCGSALESRIDPDTPPAAAAGV